jgi:hypothetical protein
MPLLRAALFRSMSSPISQYKIDVLLLAPECTGNPNNEALPN